MADVDEITLSPNTHAALQGVTRARHELDAWTHNLESALADDVAAGRLTADQAADVAKDAELKSFKAPKPGDAPPAVETTAEANEAQRAAVAEQAEAQAKADQETAAKAAKQQAEVAEKAAKAAEAPAPAKADDDEGKKGAAAHHR